jgi:hypothetical protein
MIVFVNGCKEPKVLKRANAREWLASSGCKNAPAPGRVKKHTMSDRQSHAHNVFRLVGWLFNSGASIAKEVVKDMVV